MNTPRTGSGPGLPDDHRNGPPVGSPTPRPLRFARSVRLSKGEVFAACQALADADRILLRAGGTAEAGALGDLFDLFDFGAGGR